LPLAVLKFPFRWQATKAGFTYLWSSGTEIECLAISPDGEEQLAASSGGTITVWTYQGTKYSFCLVIALIIHGVPI